MFPGNRTHNLCAANAMLYHWDTTESQSRSHVYLCWTTCWSFLRFDMRVCGRCEKRFWDPVIFIRGEDVLGGSQRALLKRLLGLLLGLWRQTESSDWLLQSAYSNSSVCSHCIQSVAILNPVSACCSSLWKMEHILLVYFCFAFQKEWWEHFAYKDLSRGLCFILRKQP